MKKLKPSWFWHRKRRFYSRMDMAIIRKDIAIHNAKIKRGEITPGLAYRIMECGCGATGCFIHYEGKQ